MLQQFSRDDDVEALVRKVELLIEVGPVCLDPEPRRLAGITALIVIDLGGLVFGIYVALIFRELYLGQWPPLWGILWSTETDWLPFLTVITVLVFWVGGLYRRRELRAGVGQVVFSLVLVAVITLAFGFGIGYHFTTYGLTPTALVLTAFFIGILRASYDVLTRH